MTRAVEVEVGRRLGAAESIGEAMHARSRADGFPFNADTDHYIALDTAELGTAPVTVETIDEMIWDLIENGPAQPGIEDVEAVIDLFLAYREVSSATLARTSMHGAWEGVDEVQEILLDMAPALSARGYDVEVLWKASPHAKLTWEVEVGLTDMPDMVAATRKRLAVNATGVDSFQIDKRSSFAIDLRALERSNPEAAREMRMFILADRYTRLDMHLLQAMCDRDGEVLARYDEEEIGALERELTDITMHADKYRVPLQVVVEAAASGDVHRLANAATIQTLEHAILEQLPVLTPALTTFYIHRND